MSTRRRGSARRTRVGKVSVYPHHGAWWVYYREGGRPVRKKVGADRLQAEQVAAQVNAQLASNAPTLLSFVPVSVPVLRHAFLDYHEHVLRSSLGTLGELNRRVRLAVAGEVGNAVAEAVGEVLAAALGGHSQRWADRPGRYGGYAGYQPPDYERDDWDDDRSARWADDRPAYRASSTGPDDNAPGAKPDGPAALALAVSAGRWWLARKGTPWGAAGVGLAVAGTLLVGGPAARPVLAVLWAVHRLLAATDALSEGAKALDKV